ncbi:hypothetical protein [Streptomyces muensis]|uniref:Uncharacterized protein n=1 Tax=Streptomyces muensis TaxID=1077944 RepID=A0A9X1Q5P7_STRM4|nr:hypothetical protein [Streptomyces muensis]MCF1599392.1 hypothetical protein [Streptomyces muensis]
MADTQGDRTSAGRDLDGDCASGRLAWRRYRPHIGWMGGGLLDELG